MKIDIKILEKLAPTFGVGPIADNPVVKQIMGGGVGEEAPSEILDILNEAGYTYSFNDQGYHNSSQWADDEQSIYVLATGVVVWIWAKQLARAFKIDPPTITKWLIGDSKYPGGKANKFIEVYSQAIGVGPKTPKTPKNRMASDEPPVKLGTMPGPVPDRSKINPPMGEADKLIASAKKKGGFANRLPADDIIDLYKKSKEFKGPDQTKLMDYIKTIKPLSENAITKSSLEKLIREIVKGIIMEGKAWEKGRKSGGGGWDMSDVETSDPDKDWVEKMANKIWEDPSVIPGRGGEKWEVNHVQNAESGETVYQLSKVQTIERKRLIVKRDGKWYYLNVNNPDGSKKWTEIPEQPTSSEEPPVQEMSGTSAAGPVTGPMAFKKKVAMENHPQRCDKCGKLTDETIDEMTTTSGGGGSSAGTSGYNIPGAFSRQMKGKDHIEVLGYTMTPIGKKEYERKGDRLLETKTTTKTCPHCNMMAVNGIWTHEQGCPAAKND